MELFDFEKLNVYQKPLMEQMLREQLTEISKMISGLINYLESDKAKNTLSEPLTDYKYQPDLCAMNFESTPNSKLSTDNGQNNSI